MDYSRKDSIQVIFNTPTEQQVTPQEPILTVGFVVAWVSWGERLGAILKVGVVVAPFPYSLLALLEASIRRRDPWVGWLSAAIVTLAVQPFLELPAVI
jgi:hypothetical protein